MKKLLLIAAATAAFTLPAAAAAQTKTGDYVQRDTRLQGDSDGKVQVKGLAKTLTPPVPSGTTLYGPCEGYPQYTYRIRQTCEPIVVTPTDIVAKLLPGVDQTGKRYVESAIRNPQISFGFNAFGGLGTVNNAGPGVPFTTDKKNGFSRLAGKTETGDDFLLPGRSQDIASVIVNGYVSSNGQLAGYRMHRGVLSDPFTFSGEVSRSLGNDKYEPLGVVVTQKVSLEGTALTYLVSLTNTSSEAKSVTYFRSEDPDSSANFSTQNKVVKQGRWEAATSTGEVYFIDSPDAGVYNATTAYDKATSVGTRRDAGYNVKADTTLQLIWPAVVLQPGQTTTVTFSQGIK